MQGKASFIFFPVVITATLVRAIATLVRIALRIDCVPRWLWRVAAVPALLDCRLRAASRGASSA